MLQRAADKEPTQGLLGADTEVLPETTSSSAARNSKSDQEERPKVAAPLGYKKKSDEEISKETKKPPKTVQKKDEDDDDDDDEDEEEEEGEGKSQTETEKFAVPARRSFSDPTKVKALPKEDDESKVASEAELIDKLKSKFPFLMKEVKLFGMKMTRLNQVFICGIIAFIGLVVIQTGVTIYGNFGGGGTIGSTVGQMTYVVPPLTGQWQIQTSSNGDTTSGTMQVQQVSSEIKGQGQDVFANGRAANFAFAGKVTNEGEVAFSKAYVIKDPQTGKWQEDHPIAFVGRLDIKNGQPLEAGGTWLVRRPVGHFLHRETKEYRGQWYARQISATASSGEAGMPSPMQPGSNAGFMNFNNWRQDQKFLAIAVLTIAGAVVVIGFSFTLFGPAGKMNIWEKQKYIPSQYRSQHKKMVKQFSKPLAPGGFPLGLRLEWKPWKITQWGQKTCLCLRRFASKIRT